MLDFCYLLLGAEVEMPGGTKFVRNVTKLFK
jgi:hypothetical protein